MPECARICCVRESVCEFLCFYKWFERIFPAFFLAGFDILFLLNLVYPFSDFWLKVKHDLGWKRISWDQKLKEKAFINLILGEGGRFLIWALILKNVTLSKIRRIYFLRFMFRKMILYTSLKCKRKNADILWDCIEVHYIIDSVNNLASNWDTRIIPHMHCIRHSKIFLHNS